MFSCQLLCGEFLDDSQVKLAASYAQLSVGNCVFQEVLSYQGTDHKGGVSIRTPHCAGGDVGCEGGKVRADCTAGADGVFEFGKRDHVLGPVVKGDFELAFDVNAADFHGLEGVLAFQLAGNEFFVVEAFGTEKPYYEADGFLVGANQLVVGFKHLADCLDHTGDSYHCYVPVLSLYDGFFEGRDKGDPPVVAASGLSYEDFT